MLLCVILRTTCRICSSTSSENTPSVVSPVSEPVKAFETSAQDFFCASFSMLGLLIHAAVGNLGGLGLRFPNRHGLAA